MSSCVETSLSAYRACSGDVECSMQVCLAFTGGVTDDLLAVERPLPQELAALFENQGG